MNTAVFNPAGTEVVAASDDGTGRVWSISRAKQLTTFGAPGNGSIIYSTFNRSGTKVPTCDEDGLATLWSTQLATPVSSLETIARHRTSVGLTSGQLSSYLPG